MYATQRPDLKGYKIPVSLEDGIEDHIAIDDMVKSESIETDGVYNTKLFLKDGKEVLANSIDLEFSEDQ